MEAADTEKAALKGHPKRRRRGELGKDGGTGAPKESRRRLRRVRKEGAVVSNAVQRSKKHPIDLAIGELCQSRFWVAVQEGVPLQ